MANALSASGESVIGGEEEDVEDEFRREEAKEKLKRKGDVAEESQRGRARR